jgi:hypothetical protein
MFWDGGMTVAASAQSPYATPELTMFFCASQVFGGQIRRLHKLRGNEVNYAGASYS